MGGTARACVAPSAGSGIRACRSVVRMRTCAGGARADRAIAAVHVRLVRGIRYFAGSAAVPLEQGRTLAAPEPARQLARQVQRGTPPAAAIEPPAALACHR